MSNPSIRNMLRRTASSVVLEAMTTRLPLSGGTRSAAAALRSGGSGVAGRSILVPCQGQRRMLSSTAPCLVHAITFTETSSPELDETLQTIRTEIFLPSYLRASQRKALYSPKHAQKLRSNPITLELDGEILRFSPMNRFDQPNARASARAAVDQMETAEDFANLPRLLEGLHQANRRLRPDDYARFARRAGERGCIFQLIEAARTVRRTGMRLETHEVVAEILHHVQLKALDSAWAEKDTRQALNWAEMVVDLVDSEGHGRRPEAHTPRFSTSSHPPPPPPAFVLAYDPQFLTARLHLAAAVAGRFSESEKHAADVATFEQYATELVQVWPAKKGLRTLHPAATYAERRGELHYLQDDNKFLGIASPLLHGLTEAKAVAEANGKDKLAEQLEARRKIVETEVGKALEKAPDRRGAAVYKKFFP